MTVLRHEEFDSGCKATCNGPYQNKWSKTMIGYGPEDSNFVLEITYNYPIDKYKIGNDILGITIGAPEDLLNGIKSKCDWKTENGKTFHVSPAGYKFFLEQDDKLKVKEVALSSSDLEASLSFWKGLLEMRVVSQTSNEAVLNYDPTTQTNLKIMSTGGW